MEKESYKIEKDDFEGDDVCKGCKKLDQLGACTVYSRDGRKYRSRMGHCPVVNRYASWHKDKPIQKVSKKRVGQQKQR